MRVSTLHPTVKHTKDECFVWSYFGIDINFKTHIFQKIGCESDLAFLWQSVSQPLVWGLLSTIDWVRCVYMNVGVTYRLLRWRHVGEVHNSTSWQIDSSHSHSLLPPWWMPRTSGRRQLHLLKLKVTVEPFLWLKICFVLINLNSWRYYYYIWLPEAQEIFKIRCYS